MTADEIGDDEFLLRHVPGGSWWQAPGPRVTSANFQLRHDRGETGVSVTRLKFTNPAQLLQRVGGSPDKGSRIAQARVGDIRALGFEVVPQPLDDDAGHAEIQSGDANLDDHASRKKLSLVFRFIETEAPPA